MKHIRDGFSLVELIISIFLLGIIVMFLYSTISNLQKSNKLFQKEDEILTKDDKILNLIYDDIFLSNNIKIDTKKYTIINLETKNTIFNITNPYVTWLVTNHDNTLIRFESILPFKDMNIDNNYYYHISEVGKNCEKFNIYQSKQKDKILIYIQFKGKEPIIYELPKPFNKKSKKENNTTKNHTVHSKIDVKINH